MSHSESKGDSNAVGLPDNWEDVAHAAVGYFDGSAGAGNAELLRELLVFALDASAYAIALDRIREVVRMRDLTRLPRTPDWLLGVMTLRGEVVEVVDLRRRLGLAARETNRASRIIVLHGDSLRVSGILVDSVSEVCRVPEQSVMPAQGFEIAAVREVCSYGEEFISILDPDLALGFHDA